MSQLSDEAVIEMEIKLTARSSDEINKKIQELKAAKQRKPAKKSEDGEESEQLQKLLEGLDEKGMNQLKSFVNNPQGFFEFGFENMIRRLGPNAPAILGIIGIVVASPVFMAELLKALSVKGGPFNRDWRRFISEEVEVGISRELQKLKELGFNQVILPQQVGFVPHNENWAYNSFMEINESRLARIGLDDRAAGVLANG